MTGSLNSRWGWRGGWAPSLLPNSSPAPLFPQQSEGYCHGWLSCAATFYGSHLKGRRDSLHCGPQSPSSNLPCSSSALCAHLLHDHWPSGLHSNLQAGSSKASGLTVHLPGMTMPTSSGVPRNCCLNAESLMACVTLSGENRHTQDIRAAHNLLPPCLVHALLKVLDR